MRKLHASLIISAICGLFSFQPGFMTLPAASAQEEPTAQEDPVAQQEPAAQEEPSSQETAPDKETVPESAVASDSAPAPEPAVASEPATAPDKEIAPDKAAAPDKKTDAAPDQESSDESRESAEILFEEALELKRTGNLAGAIESFARSIRMDRSILANDDQGLIEDLKKDCEEKLKKTPDDVKMLEMLGFVFAVCYSDQRSAITCYQKVYDLVTDERVKERTGALIERLKMSEEVQQSYQQEVTASLRDERLKSWSEMERVNRFGEESAQMQQKSADLADAYKAKDELANRVPQLEQELKDMQAEYDKANRLFHSVSDNAMYERRRRRLKDDIAVKEKEVEDARAELSDAESTAATLEKDLAKAEKAKEASPIRSYDDNDAGNDTGNGEAGDADPDDSDQDPSNPPDDNSGNPPADDGSSSSGDSGDEEPLPTPDNPDFPPDGDDAGAGETPAPSSPENLDDHIDNL